MTEVLTSTALGGDILFLIRAFPVAGDEVASAAGGHRAAVLAPLSSLIDLHVRGAQRALIGRFDF
jgi:hypothetical protein